MSDFLGPDHIITKTTVNLSVDVQFVWLKEIQGELNEGNGRSMSVLLKRAP